MCQVPGLHDCLAGHSKVCVLTSRGPEYGKYGYFFSHFILLSGKQENVSRKNDMG